jgi:uncharacterized protein (DUF302 family)
MTVAKISGERFSVTSLKAFGEVIKALGASVGHPNMNSFWSEIVAAKSYGEVEKIIGGVTGASGFMEFTRFDHGGVVRKANGEASARCVRFLIGNPLVMKRMVEHVPDAGSYAPVTILVDERADGVRLSYDRMAGFLSGYGNEAALTVARDLDAKIERILIAAAG